MKSKKFFSSLFVTALLAGVIAFYGCKKDSIESPADDGKKSAQELCDSFSQAESDAAKVACIETFESIRQKYKDEDAVAFENAFNQEIEKCGSKPFEWYSAYLGTKAAQEMCDCFSINPDNQQAQMQCMMGLMMKYGGYFRSEDSPGDPIFEGAFDVAFYSCANVPDWFICMWSPENCSTDN